MELGFFTMPLHPPGTDYTQSLASDLQIQNIILGTGVNYMPNHHPFVVASRIAQLDHLCHGRFHWGVGSGGFEEVEEMLALRAPVYRECADHILNAGRSPEQLVDEVFELCERGKAAD